MNDTLRQLLAAATKEQLDRVTPAALLAPAPIVATDEARLVQAALYLKHGHLDASHKICQSVSTPNGSYWHGIMHRHEGDLENSRYWYARVGSHPVLAEIGGYPRDAAVEAREFDLLLHHTIACATGQETTPTVLNRR